MKLKLFLFLLIITHTSGCIQHHSNLNENIKLVSKNDTISEISKAELALAKANYENSEKLLTHTYWVIDVILIGFFVSIIISFMAFWWNNERIKKDMNKYIADQIETEITNLKSMIKGYNHEKELIQKTSIMVLVKNGVEIPNYVQLVLNQFNSPVRRNLSSITEINKDFDEYDIIFYFNEGDNKWTDNWNSSDEQNKLIKFINDEYQGAILYFGIKFNFDEINESKKHLISASNFSSQIYGNMLNQMKLLHALKNNKPS